MLNIISFLLIVVISFIRMKSGYTSNPLMDGGMLLLSAYVFSLIMNRMKLPLFFGYIAAGILVGDKGLAFISDNFTGQMSFIENIVLMIVVSTAVQAMIRQQSLLYIVKNFFSGVLAAMAASVITFACIIPLTLPLPAKIALSLFASVYSPLIIANMGNGKNSPISSHQTAYGGFVCSIVLWGITTAYFVSEGTGGLKLAFMPMIIGLSSLVTGFVWAFAAEKIVSIPEKNEHSLFSIAILLLLYPFIKIFGLDFLFLAIGIGLSNGLLSERKLSYLERSHIPVLILFVLFGTKISLEDMYLFGKTGWISALVIVVVFVVSRMGPLYAASRLISKKRLHYKELRAFVAFGPLSVILLRRFLPGFRNVLGDDMQFHHLYVLCTLLVFLSIVLSLIMELGANFSRDKKLVQPEGE
ncbi:hypothetical protein ACFL60_08400 [Candidatus Omnitrophota bacterium]